MATESLARLIVKLEAQTAQYQKGMEDATRQLTGFRQNTERQLGNIDQSFKRFSRGVHEVLAGGGILIGFKALLGHLDKVAEKFKTTDAAAANFARTAKTLSDNIDQAWLALLRLLAPLIKHVGDEMDPAARATDRLAIATNNLKEAEANLAKARTDNRANFNLLGKLPSLGAGGQSIEKLEAALAKAQSDLVAAQASLQAAILNKSRIPGDLDETGPANLVGDILKGLEDAQKKADDARKKRFEELDRQAKERFENLLADEGKALDQQEKQIADSHDKWVKADKERFEQLLDQESDMLKKQKAAEDEINERREKAAETFGDLFANVLVQSNKAGLKQVLADFLQTLAIMAARAQAMKLFNLAQSSGGWFGSAVTAIFGGAKAMGGPVGAGRSYLVGEQGPEMFIPRTSGTIVPNGMGGGVTINQSFAVGDIATKSQVVAMASMAKDAAKAEIFQLIKRGRI